VKNGLRALLAQQGEESRSEVERMPKTNALVKEFHEKMPTARLMHTVPEFGVFLAVLVAEEIKDIGRFEEVGKFHAYAGLIPSTHSSGEMSCMASSSRKGIAGCVGGAGGDLAGAPS